MAKKDSDKIIDKIIVKIEFVTDISLWDALKLRLAGGKAIKEFIDAKVEELKIVKEVQV